ncbi:MAG: UDP-N-acetylglucosamine 1-carboxyvinyltransferase [Candidatus Spyradocola sp.]|nr:UDP-N-acetylglucosamine 1-carboxyvinyltransferase [Candidatus Spyradocola sp.]
MAEKLRIYGGRRLEGTVVVNGGKNAALAIIPAALLSSEPCTIENLPQVSDIAALRDILEELGAKVTLNGSSMTIDPRGVHRTCVPEELARRLRASYYFVGALLGVFGKADVSYPGGCAIGSRPIDQHIKGFEALGAEVTVDNSMICARAEDGLHGAEIYLDMPSVGATINIMLAATRAKGNTIIVNAGKEPHIVDLANFINAMGGSVKGAGTDTIRIRGGRPMHGCTYAVIPDQIEAGTLMIAAAATAGDVLIRGALPTHMEALTAKLLEMGARVDEGIGEDSIRVRSDGNHRHVNIKTLPYPGFPTDLQQPMSALLSTARGTSIINETIYEQRHRHLEEIRRMGGQSQIHERIAIIEGVPKLTGCAVTATDLRAGAALVVAGLMAEGVTDIYNVQFIDRGYEHLEKKLSQLGAKIERLPADAD